MRIRPKIDWDHVVALLDVLDSCEMSDLGRVAIIGLRGQIMPKYRTVRSRREKVRIVSRALHGRHENRKWANVRACKFYAENIEECRERRREYQRDRRETIKAKIMEA